MSPRTRIAKDVRPLYLYQAHLDFCRGDYHSIFMPSDQLWLGSLFQFFNHLKAMETVSSETSFLFPEIILIISILLFGIACLFGWCIRQSYIDERYYKAEIHRLCSAAEIETQKQMAIKVQVHTQFCELLDLVISTTAEGQVKVGQVRWIWQMIEANHNSLSTSDVPYVDRS
tara:strand:+ start:1075 stop:1590 length:516 start_codon:yes stop_codon:yes gene_type:complete